MNIGPAEISGFFRIDSQTRGKRITWILGILGGLALLSLGVHQTMIIISNHDQAPEGIWIPIFILFFFVIPAYLIFTGLFKMFQKPGVYFKGIRTTDSGFETGSLTVDLASVEPKNTWRKSCSGKILAGNWEPERTITANPLSVVVFLQRARDYGSWFFDRIEIASKGETFYQLSSGVTSFAEIVTNRLVTILNGNFQILADKKSFLLPLERVADVLSTSFSVNPPSCTLNLVTGTNIFTPSLMTFGAVGGLVSGGIDSLRKREMREAFKKGRLFDADFTEKLIDFLNRHGWMITINGK